MSGLELTQVMEVISSLFEIAGVIVILAGAAACVPAARKASPGGVYAAIRATFGRGVLLGLEVLVAADIIRTIAVSATLTNLAVLAALVVIRTFLSWSLEVEIEGHWPWQHLPAEAEAEGSEASAI